MKGFQALGGTETQAREAGKPLGTSEAGVGLALGLVQPSAG